MKEDLSALALPLASVLGFQPVSSDPFEKPDQRKKLYKLLDGHGAVEMRRENHLTFTKTLSWANTYKVVDSRHICCDKQDAPHSGITLELSPLHIISVPYANAFSRTLHHPKCMSPRLYS